MKILVVCQYYYPENFIITNICEELVKKGHEVTVLTGLPNYGFDHILPEYKKVRYEEINGVKVHRVKLVAKAKNKIKIILNYLSYWKNAKHWIRNCKEEYDVVFSMSLSPVTILSPANLYKKKHHVKHVCYCVDLWPESVLVTKAVKKKSLMYRVLYRWSKNLYKKVDQIIVGSPSFVEYFKEVLKVDEENIPVVVQPPLFSLNDEVKPHEYPNGFHILYCGNLGRIQMVEKIPEAMTKVDNKNIYFDIIGMGPKKEELLANIAKYKVSDNVIYHGPIPARYSRAYFSSADALYVSLKNDGYVGKTIPNKLVMSMAFNKPILAMLGGDGKTLLDKTGGGLLVEENSDDLAAKILQISTLSKEKLLEMGSRNYNYFTDNLALDNAVNKIELLLKKCSK